MYLCHMLKRYPYIAFVIPAAVFIISRFLSFLKLPPEVYTGLTYDLIILSPALYFLAIRKTSIPNITVVPVLFAGVLVGRYVLPVYARTHLDLLELYLLPLVELVVMFTVGYYAYRTIRATRETRDQRLDFFQALEQASRKVMGHPKLAKILSLEFGGIYYALFKWRGHEPEVNEYTTHRTSGLLAILYTVIGITIIETFVLHLLLIQWSSTFAWILTILSIYGGLVILAHIKAIGARPHVMLNASIEFKNGLFGYAHVPFTEISEVIIDPKEEGAHALALLGNLENPNVLIKVKNELEAEGAYGKRYRYRSLLVHADDPGALQEAIMSNVEPNVD